MSRSVLLFEGSSRVGVLARHVCECVHLFASKHQNGLAGKQEMNGVDKRAQDLSRVLDRAAMLIFEASRNVHVTATLESGGMCVFADELQSLSAG